MPEPLDVVGVGADGWAGLTPAVQRVVAEADVLIGAPRVLDGVPLAVVRVAWPSPLREGLPALLSQYDGQRVVAFASGDPLLSGVGTTLIDLLGPDRVVVHPGVSSVALARARMGWSAESSVVVSLVGRDPHLLLRELAPGRRIVALSSDETTPAVVEAMLGEHAGTITVLGDLGTDHESRTHDVTRAPRLNVLAIEVDGPGLGWSTGLPDDVFENDGQLTKRDLRASALARLAPQPGQLLWDVGAGAGSVGVEWMRAHPSCRAIAIEADPERAARITRNAARLGVPGLEVVTGRAPEALDGLEAPDAIFVGGGATRPGVVDACLARAARLVVHGVTLETERLLADLYDEHGGELTRISVETAAPIGTFTGWTPARAVTQWSWTP